MTQDSLFTFRPALLALAGLLFGCTATAEAPEDDGEEAGGREEPIVGGTNANIADYPWQVSLQIKSGSGGSHICGGSILNESWILTAQHCTDGSSASQLRIAAGMSKLSQASSTGQVRNVAKIVSFPGYTDASKGKDIALLQLSTPLNLSSPNVKAIPIMTQALADSGLTAPGVAATVTGWGTLSSNGSSPDTLQRVSVPLLSNSKAQSAYTSETITSDQLAAGDMTNGGKDSCQGDSGGPLVVPNGQGGVVLAGVVSWGYGCADKQYPGMYARVSSFATWINSYATTTPSNPSQPSNPPAGAGINQSGLTGAKGSWRDFTIQIPAGTAQLVAKMSGGSGDGDLYVRFGSLPSTSAFDCRPYLDGNGETCTIQAPKAGTWYVSIYGYQGYSNVSLTASP
jgi:trypsin